MLHRDSVAKSQPRRYCHMVVEKTARFSAGPFQSAPKSQRSASDVRID